ncbi:MAG: hypothetical protein HQL52_11850 [Magnetococcales bacterium]|nr:hypothetical protein [Magnetococcales bacterium]
MMGGVGFPYAQARIQARHKRHLDETEWERLLAIEAFSPFLQQARETDLAPWLLNIAPETTIHQLEGRLREGFRLHVSEVASWLPIPWQPAVQWTGVLPELPALAYLKGGGTPLSWMFEDPLLGPLVDAEGAKGGAGVADLGLLLTHDRSEASMLTAWGTHFFRLMPALDRHQKAAFKGLIQLVESHLEALAAALPGSETGREGLRRQLVLRFRRHLLKPSAVFIHLFLTALELERLRGALARRLLFAPGGGAS